MPERDADFLLGAVNATLRTIMTTVVGQFITHNETNNQYYIDLNNITNYDEQIKLRATLLADGELNRYFYQVVYSCLEWDKKQYVWFSEILSYCQKPLKNKAFPTSIVSYLSFSDASLSACSDTGRG